MTPVATSQRKRTVLEVMEDGARYSEDHLLFLTGYDRAVLRRRLATLQGRGTLEVSLFAGKNRIVVLYHKAGTR